MKVIATIGPSSSNKKVLSELINNGVDVFRLNFSHFYQREFIRILNDSRSIKKDINIMADLCGKKVRVAENLKSVANRNESNVSHPKQQRQPRLTYLCHAQERGSVL